MTSDYQQPCGERTPSTDQRPHVCTRQPGHPGAHHCTCPFTWMWDERHDLEQLWHDHETTSA